jgi:hypothetical protein
VTFLHLPSLASLLPTAYTDFAAPPRTCDMFLTILRDFCGGEGMSLTTTQPDSTDVLPQFYRFSGFILVNEDQFIP